MKAGLIAWFCVALAAGGLYSQETPRRHFPRALRHVPLGRLSSGALMRIDRGGDLITWPNAPTTGTTFIASASSQTVTNALDPRIGGNISLGDDPPQLPSNMRAQAEPHIARHILDPDLLVATFQEGRFTDGGAVDCGYAISHDGGLTWSRRLDSLHDFGHQRAILPRHRPGGRD